jgi:hypothetical protein
MAGAGTSAGETRSGFARDSNTVRRDVESAMIAAAAAGCGD